MLLGLENKPEIAHERIVDQYERRYNDTTTLAAEMLDGSMQTSFEYTFDGEELYAQDGSSIGGIFHKAETDAYIIATTDPRLQCEIRRRGEVCEKGEYKDMLAMARGEGENTMVVVSDAPTELLEWGEDVGGYNYKRQQTMLRVVSRLPDGNIKVTSQTLDRSDRDGLEAIYEFFGIVPRPGELLGQRIKVETDPLQQDLLVDDLTRVYDKKLESKNGGRYFAGRTPADMDNTYTFVCAQKDLLHAFMQEESDESLLGLIAALENRWNAKKQYRGYVKSGDVFTFAHSMTPQAEIFFMAQKAIEQGKTYSGCGVTISAGGELEALGYGNKTSSESDHDCEFISKKCPLCSAKNVKTTVTKAKIKGSCGCSKDR